MGVLSGILCIIGYMWSEPGVYLPWRVDTACVCILFVYIGYLIRNLEDIRKIILSKMGLQ